MQILESPVTNARLALAALPPLSLYVHIPWCVRKCPYCDFNSHEIKGSHPGDDTALLNLESGLEQRYIHALIADLDRALPQVWGRPVYTVFFGGGTPSLFLARGLHHLLSALPVLLPPPPDPEITLE